MACDADANERALALLAHALAERLRAVRGGAAEISAVMAAAAAAAAAKVVAKGAAKSIVKNETKNVAKSGAESWGAAATAAEIKAKDTAVDAIDTAVAASDAADVVDAVDTSAAAAAAAAIPALDRHIQTALDFHAREGRTAKYAAAAHSVQLAFINASKAFAPRKRSAPVERERVRTSEKHVRPPHGQRKTQAVLKAQ